LALLMRLDGELVCLAIWSRDQEEWNGFLLRVAKRRDFRRAQRQAVIGYGLRGKNRWESCVYRFVIFEEISLKTCLFRFYGSLRAYASDLQSGRADYNIWG